MNRDLVLESGRFATGTARRQKPSATRTPANNYNVPIDFVDLPPDQLLQACALPGSSGAWEEFMRRYHPVLTAAAIRVSNSWGTGSPDEIDDVVQEIYLKLCAGQARILTSFEETRPEAVFGYLKVVATNTARDYFRKRSATKRQASQTMSLDEMGDVAAPGNEIERQLTFAEVDKLLLHHTQTETGARDRGIFVLYYRHGMTAQAVANLPGVGLSPKGVEGVLQRLTKAIRQTIAKAQESGGD
jgi:RNA polymerase sigma-70 factor (ECF subfamily)